MSSFDDAPLKLMQLKLLKIREAEKSEVIFPNGFPLKFSVFQPNEADL